LGKYIICIIAGDYQEALRFASGQLLSNSEWFFPADEDDLKRHSNFHVLVIGTAGQNVPSSYFERILRVAQERGRMK